MLSTLIDKLRAKARRHLVGAHRVVGRRVERTGLPLQRLGTSYGGWTFLPTAELCAGGLVVCCGAGEDISFDIELVRQFGCSTVIIDPTPRAIAHFEEVCAAIGRGERYPVNRSDSDFYEPADVDIRKLAFVARAIWSESASLKFYLPRNPEHVSHSLVNLQNTDNYIEVEACPLSGILGSKVEAGPVLVKLDIEGAEHVVIRSMLGEGFRPQQILVEFDQLNFPSRRALVQVESTIQYLADAGYRFIHFDGMSNCLFLQADLISGS